MKKLKLRQSQYPGVRIGTKSDGRKYSVREDRRRYFFPKEWNAFINSISNKQHRFFFLTLLHTGARIMEGLNIKYEDIDEERGTINLTVVKQKKAKKNSYASGKSRRFFVANNFIKEYKKFVRGKKINTKEYIFLNNSILPKDYDSLDNQDKKKYYVSRTIAYSAILKRKLKKIYEENKTVKDPLFEDWYNFSPHNIRKTYGMWMRTYNKEIAELCYRMGHDIDTYLAHYGSSLIFTEAERRDINKIMGDVK